MKKTMILTAVLFLFGNYLFPQTWTERHNMGGELGNVDYECTVITKQQYDRLLNQHTAMGEYAVVQFVDNLEMLSSGRVIKGSRPRFNGYYYILTKITLLTDTGKQLFNLTGTGTRLEYGHSNTGCLLVAFGNYMLSFAGTGSAGLLGSNDFTRKYNQCLRFVNGE